MVCPAHLVQEAAAAGAALLPLQTGRILVTSVARARSQIGARCQDEAGPSRSLAGEGGAAAGQEHLMHLEQGARLALRRRIGSGVWELASPRGCLRQSRLCSYCVEVPAAVEAELVLRVTVGPSHLSVDPLLPRVVTTVRQAAAVVVVEEEAVVQEARDYSQLSVIWQPSGGLLR